jgi:hypothetical protein
VKTVDVSCIQDFHNIILGSIRIGELAKSLGFDGKVLERMDSEEALQLLDMLSTGFRMVVFLSRKAKNGGDLPAKELEASFDRFSEGAWALLRLIMVEGARLSKLSEGFSANPPA